MSEPPGEPTHDYAARGEPFMVVDRIAQELITQQLQAALEQLDVITAAIREDEAATNLSLVYVSSVNARNHVDGALKQLPWAPLPGTPRQRPVIAPPPDSGSGSGSGP